MDHAEDSCGEEAEVFELFHIFRSSELKTRPAVDTSLSSPCIRNLLILPDFLSPSSSQQACNKTSEGYDPSAPIAIVAGSATVRPTASTSILSFDSCLA